MNKVVEKAKHILIIQAENPDADSLASSLALEQILGDMDKEVSMYCPMRMPRHLRHIAGWDRVENTLPGNFDASIIVDTSRMTLLNKVFSPEQQPLISARPIIVIDHHEVDSDIPFDVTDVSDKQAASTGEVIYHLSMDNKWPLNDVARNMIVISIMADTLGLTTAETSPETYRVVAQLVENGVEVHVLDEQRRMMMKRPADITEYKGKLLQRIEYAAHGSLAYVVIPWEEIEEFSERYNPSNLVIEDMRLTEGVKVALAYKLYNDGHLTGKIRCNSGYPIASKLAATQGGGGHEYAAGFKVFDADFESIKHSIIQDTMKLIKEIEDEAL